MEGAFRSCESIRGFAKGRNPICGHVPRGFGSSASCQSRPEVERCLMAPVDVRIDGPQGDVVDEGWHLGIECGWGPGWYFVLELTPNTVIVVERPGHHPIGQLTRGKELVEQDT